MDLRVSISSSDLDFIEYYRKGISLKSRALKRWLKKHSVSQGQLAKVLGISKRVLRLRLFKKYKFTREEIIRLIYFIGAKAALNVLWFPTINEKRRVIKSVRGIDMKQKTYKRQNYLTQAEKRKRQIIKESDYAIPWEESDEFYELIFFSNELPSNSFFKGRDYGKRTIGKP